MFFVCFTNRNGALKVAHLEQCMGIGEASRMWLGVGLGVGLMQGVVRAIGARMSRSWLRNLGNQPESFKRAGEGRVEKVLCPSKSPGYTGTGTELWQCALMATLEWCLIGRSGHWHHDLISHSVTLC